MIGKLTGRFGGEADGGAVIIEVGGVGYVVRTPLFAIDLLRASAGGEISMFIHTAVREDALDLYGFPTEIELAFFKQLMSVSGIGPKSALGIMQVADVASLKRAIAAGDQLTLVKVFGIGKKSSERIVVELRDKLASEAKARGISSDSLPLGDTEVIEALMALGYRADESRRAVKDIPNEIVGVRERLSAALKQLGTRAL
jgi:Holliday junction DNA helicase RuvA